MPAETGRTVALRPVPKSRLLVFLLLAGAGLVWDLWTKHAIFAELGYPGGNPVVAGRHEVFPHPPFRHGETLYFLDGWLKFRLFTSFNEGALWGLGQGWTAVFAALSVAAFAFIVYWLFFRGAAGSLWLTVALGFITAGTLGNLFDRLGLHGYHKQNGEPWRAVRDFLHFQFGTFNWPVFNFADVFLVTGAIMLVLQSLFVGSEEAAGRAVTPPFPPLA
ncbi:MAG: signal peptidase II, partial [Planctomycetes bacterium]|nr:signal peptidase II [Planctomycetota bacterium]